MSTLKPRFSILLILSAVLFSAGCAPVVRERTLPPSIRSVYVPMALNRTAEPGLEERVTVAIQEEFLADGRLNVTGRSDADAIVHVTLDNFTQPAFVFDEDHFPTLQEYRLEANVDIQENITGLPLIGGTRDVRASTIFNADTRSTTFEPEPDAKAVLHEAFARMVVLEVLTGEFSEEDYYRGGRAIEIEPEEETEATGTFSTAP